MKRRITAVLMALFMLAMSAAPALARASGPVQPHPESPRGLEQSGVDRPDNAPTPDTGRQNSQHRNPCSVGQC